MKLFLVALAAIVAVAAATCTSDGVTSQSSCQAQCASCTCAFAEVAGIAGCSCVNNNDFTVEYVCTDAGSIDDIDFDDFDIPNIDDIDIPNIDDINFDDFSFDDVDIGDVRDFLVSILGSDCRSAVNSAITNSFFNCVADTTAIETALDFDDGFTAAALSSVCGNTCLRTMIRSITTLADADCLPFGGDDDFFGGDDDLFDISLIESSEDWLGVLCARGNGNYCGVVFGIAEDFVDSDTISAADCQTIVDSGNCLGTIAAGITSGAIPLDDDSIDVDAVADALNDACSDEGVTGVSQAAAGTEAPANLGSSSASTTVASVFAAVAMVAAAALF